ncbi:UDP-N-acetylmuramoyl-L-alanyl-D-glutamate--2,6-diaminopimelate ligase [Candidatus Shapirobacteria bacterium]|nr:UDP-N-acetylmuramoyl-L-alanyl-D-glutamate--2,6-diaminopimelate ligase [Candidatus Shapirobacteria bacterium]
MCWSKFRKSFLGEKLRLFFPNWVVNVFKHFPLAFLAIVFFGYPARRLRIIGITGTDGKTTTSNLIHWILTSARRKTGLISTGVTKLGTKEIHTGLHVTSPEPWILQRLLRRFVKEGVKDVVLEATSQGLVQNRLWGCHFLIAAVTNVTHEHLDYHQSYQNYLQAKNRLFKRVKIAVLNKDDESYSFFQKEIQKTKAKLVTYGLKSKADFTPQSFPFKTKLLGEFNQYNCLAAAAVTSSLGINKGQIKKAIATFEGVKGRLEEVKAGQPFRVFIDFAHTPNALGNTLKALKSITPKGHFLIAVFGSAGGRDKSKRPLMGEQAAQYADLVVLTEDDPRNENVEEIIEQIAQGCLKAGAKEDKTLFRIPNRGQAMRVALKKLAQKDDIVVICGKGHQQVMYGKTEYPWNDFQVAQKIIKGRK